MNDTWGYKKNDHNWKSSKTLIRNLVEVSSKGGNYLLNVGPTAEGRFPRASFERLAAIGDWMRVNGESIYGTSASPFGKLPWGRATHRVGDQCDNIYLHVFDWPADNRITVPAADGEVTSVTSLANGSDLRSFALAKILSFTFRPRRPTPSIRLLSSWSNGGTASCTEFCLATAPLQVLGIALREASLVTWECWTHDQKNLGDNKATQLGSQDRPPLVSQIEVWISWAAACSLIRWVQHEACSWHAVLHLVSPLSYTLMNICQRELSGTAIPGRSSSSCKRW